MDDQAPTRIGEHGVIGDLETIALVGNDAGVEWLCWPRFDSPSLFGALLDSDGGRWTIRPDEGNVQQRKMYLPDTNVLLTRFHTENGVAEVFDFMVVDGEQRALVRCVTGLRDSITMTSSMTVRPDYGRQEVALATDDSGAVTVTAHGLELLAQSTEQLETTDDGSVTATFTLEKGHVAIFSLGEAVDIEGSDLLATTTAFWRDWVGATTYRGRWREWVHRSALALKLLTHRSSGGVLAAGTTSLPEALGGKRNWDYRYVWIRDAAFTLYAFLELGLIDEADAFTGWLTDRLAEADCSTDESPLSPLYDLDGNADLEEQELDHWSGYGDSGPVRIGNAASNQLQLDIYGELIDSMYLADKHGPGLSLGTWDQLRALVDWVCAHWDQPDDGMWEVRSGRQRFTSSALLCWVAVERGIRMATFRGRPADLDTWRACRDSIHGAIVERGWSDELEAFTQTFDGNTVDASILLMPLLKFIPATDPKWQSTARAVDEALVHGVLVDRYDNSVADDGLQGDDGSFSICSFWNVEALARAGRVDEARNQFERMLTFAGPLGLFSEVISPTGQQLGNYPQAFTHLSLISAAVHLDQALDDQ